LLFQISSPEESLQQAIADFAQHCGGLRLGIREVAQVSARKGVSRKLGMARHACGLEQSVYRRQSADVGSNMASWSLIRGVGNESSRNDDAVYSSVNSLRGSLEETWPDPRKGDVT
jgi:hypothetical protein